MSVEITAALDAYSTPEMYCADESDSAVLLTPIAVDGDEVFYESYTLLAIEVNGVVVTYVDLSDLREALYALD